MYPKIAITEVRSSCLDIAKESDVGESGGDGLQKLKFPIIGFFSELCQSLQKMRFGHSSLHTLLWGWGHQYYWPKVGGHYRHALTAFSG